jgi:hypothetical protein
MQRHWEPEELIEQWTLLPADRALPANKSGSTRLGFAILLLYFQHEGRFPLHRHDVARPVVAHIAAQAGVPATEYPRYPWDGRSIKYHRAQIRDALGSRAATVPDAAELTEWLCTHAVARDALDTAVTAAAYQRLRALKTVNLSFSWRPGMSTENEKLPGLPRIRSSSSGWTRTGGPGWGSRR